MDGSRSFMSASFRAVIESKKESSKKRLRRHLDASVDEMYGLFTEEFNRRLGEMHQYYQRQLHHQQQQQQQLQSTSESLISYGSALLGSYGQPRVYFSPEHQHIFVPTFGLSPPGAVSTATISTNLYDNLVSDCSYLFSQSSSSVSPIAPSTITVTNWTPTGPSMTKTIPCTVPLSPFTELDPVNILSTSLGGRTSSASSDKTIVNDLTQSTNQPSIKMEFSSITTLLSPSTATAPTPTMVEPHFPLYPNLEPDDDTQSCSSSVICLEDENDVAEASAAEVAAAARRRATKRAHPDDEGAVNESDAPEDGEIVDVNNNNNSPFLTFSASPSSGTTKFTIYGLKCYQDDCTSVFATKAELGLHLINSHRIFSFRCLQGGCKKSFYFVADLIAHMEDHRSVTEWFCDYAWCGKTFKSYRTLWLHNNQSHQMGVFKCTSPDCSFVGTNRQQMNSHHGRQHRRLTCAIADCALSFPNRYYLSAHQRDDHSCGKLYSCKWEDCVYESKHLAAIISHVRGVHFRLPITRKEQKERGIVDERNANDFINIISIHPLVPPPQTHGPEADLATVSGTSGATSITLETSK